MEYDAYVQCAQQTGLANTTLPECEVTPLDSIGAIAEEAERAGTYISAFIARFRHGKIPEAAPGSIGQLKPVPSGHAGQIDRLRDAIATIDRVARELQTIG